MIFITVARIAIMEKKQYIIPVTEIVETEMEMLMATSALLNDEETITDPTDIGSREDSFLFE